MPLLTRTLCKMDKSGAALLLLFLFATLLLYLPGLKGPFLFDDFANLPALGEYGGIRNWETLRLYLAKAQAGPTGRPVSLLSFLLNATNWPAAPYPFKLTNLLLHLTNGALLYLLLNKLMRLRFEQPRARWIALIATVWWLLHPMFVSTVLYVVQRMAMLPVTFTLIGFLAYLHGRQSIPGLRGYLWMSGGIGVATILATFSKENGALLPLLLLITELVWISPHSKRQPDWRWLTIFLILPSVAVIGYLLLKIPHAANYFSLRPFTMGERVLTETRILCEYLWKLIVPNLAGSGLFHDDYPVSTNWLTPKTTLPALIFLATLFLSALILRRRYPLYSLAILFFLAGHLIESTVIPLELYFEHRNYLPALFLFLPFAWGIEFLSRQQRLAWSIPLLLLITFGVMVHLRASTWSNEQRILLTWAHENPESERAQVYGVLALQKLGQHQEAFQLLNRAFEDHPDSMALLLRLMLHRCSLGLDNTRQLQSLYRMLENQRFDPHHFNLTEVLLKQIHGKQCHGLPSSTAYELLDHLGNNRFFTEHRIAKRKITHWQGQFLLNDDCGQEALNSFHESQRWLPDLEAGMVQVALLATSGYYELALSHLNHLKELKQQGKGIKPGLNFDFEIPRIEQQLLEDMRRQISRDKECSLPPDIN